MQLKDKSGICCDGCGLNLKSDFTYYSFDYKQVMVVSSRVPSLDLLNDMRSTHSLDFCPACYDKTKHRVITNYARMMDKVKSHACELTGKVLTGNYTFYYCIVAEVIVRMTGQANICIKCKTSTMTTDQQCNKCSGREFVRPASVKANHRIVEFSICEAEFKLIIDNAIQVKASNDSGWTSKS